MALFKMNPAYSTDPEMCFVAGSYVCTNASAPAANTVVQAALFKATANAGGAALGQNETVAPQGTKVPCVLNPTPAYHPAVATGGSTSVAMFDLRAYPGDIVSVNVTSLPAVSGTAGALNLTSTDATVVGIDQTNNFVYVLYTNGSGTAQPLQGGVAIHFQVFFKDTFAP